MSGEIVAFPGCERPDGSTISDEARVELTSGLAKYLQQAEGGVIDGAFVVLTRQDCGITSWWQAPPDKLSALAALGAIEQIKLALLAHLSASHDGGVEDENEDGAS